MAYTACSVWALAVVLGRIAWPLRRQRPCPRPPTPAATIPNTTAGEPIIAYATSTVFSGLSRPSPPAGDLSYSRAEAARIALRAASRRHRDLAEDRAQVVRIVATRTGLTGPDAEARVTDFFRQNDYGHQEGSSERRRGRIHDRRRTLAWVCRCVVRGGRGRQPSRRNSLFPELAADPLTTVVDVALEPF